MHRLTKLAWIALSFLGLSVAQAQDIEVTLRLHEDKVQTLDPLFMEVTLVNKGREPLTVNKPDFATGTLAIRFLDPQREISMLSPASGGGSVDKLPTITLEPNRPVVVREYLFLPGVRWRQHEFWAAIRGLLYVSAEYRPVRRGVVFTSESVLVSLNYRDDDEMRAILSALGDDVPAEPNAVNPIELGVPLFDLSSGPRSRTLANQIERGGFKDVLLLIAQMQEIRQNDATARKESEQRLVEWLLKQPNIKGRVLTEKALAVARNHRLASTADALER